MTRGAKRRGKKKTTASARGFFFSRPCCWVYTRVCLGMCVCPNKRAWPDAVFPCESK